MRFLFVDRIDRIVAGRMARGIKTVSFEEGFLPAPYPVLGTFPRLLILEAAAQLASWLVLYSSDFQKIPLIAKMEKVELMESVFSGDCLQIEVELASLEEDGALIHAKVFKENRIIATGKNCLCTFAGLETLDDPERLKAVFLELTQHASFQ